ncbi:hypothetical protein conserved [Leishmania donovani]|uniref:Hypothetical_protein_conserved n=1 Tax=Leishmania donovani TaxID=5661 RepID=A0A6J8FAP0_LEIDO|nr:hypothetical protein conserved [Leishmania donovani]VDZ43158.1 hypothetical_protein_conserved [Leishmania donovani]
MKRGVRQAKSLHVLQRLLGPVVALYISRCRAKADVAREASLYHAPSIDALKQLPIFAKWPDSALQTWLSHGVMVVHRKGTCIGFACEPPQAARVFWVIAGKVAQVPAKSELRECAGELLHLPPNAPKTGPVVLPAHFLEDSAKAALPSLTPTQERIKESLATYHAGHFVDAERLLLGGGRRRSLRCQTDTVMLSFPFSLFLREVQCLPGPLRSDVIDVARTVAQRAMTQLGEMPSVHSLASANPVLQSLPLRDLRALRLQLRPFVFLQFDAICEDVANSDKVFFLSLGKVLIEDCKNRSSTIISKVSTAVGLETFVPCRFPDYYDQKLRAEAATYCEMWCIPTAALLTLCSAETQLRCAQAATQLLADKTRRFTPASALRTCPCFAGVSEAAIAAVARALQVRVYCADDTIVASKRAPSTGILVVAGTVVVHSNRKRAPEPLRAGQARYFCECFVKMALEESVISQSSSIVLHGSPGAIFELIEALDTASNDIKIMLDSAQEYVNGQYGAGASNLSKAQNAAAERVRAYKRRRAGAAPTPSPPSTSIDTVDNITVLENELLASLALQLQALHPDTGDEARFDVLRVGELTMVDDDAPSDSRSAAECFSLDDEGRLVTCALPALVTSARPLTEVPVAPSPVIVAPRTDVVAASLQQRGKTKEKTSSAQETAAVVPRSLRTAVCASTPAAAGQRSVPSPRLTALRTTAARLREEADGVDRRREYQRQLLRAKHSL